MRRMAPLLRAWRITFVVSALLALIAGLMLFAGATETDRFFSWTIAPPQTASYLGATYWAVVILFLAASRAPSWGPMRLAAWAEASAALLLLVTTLLHTEKFHDDLLGYFWIAAYALAAPFLLTLLAITESRARSAAAEHGAAAALPPGLKALLALQALVFGLAGVALFALPDAVGDIWAWELTPLTARAIASFAIGFAVAGAVAVHDARLASLRAAAWAYLALGLLEILGAALHGSDFRSGAGLAAFLAFWLSVSLVGAWGLQAGRSARSARSVS